MPDKKRRPCALDDDFVERVGEMVSYFMDIRGNAPEDCHALASAVKEHIRARYAGERVTIKKMIKNDIRARVRAEYTGRNMAELVERYGVSRRTVYNYLKD